MNITSLISCSQVIIHRCFTPMTNKQCELLPEMILTKSSDPHLSSTTICSQSDSIEPMLPGFLYSQNPKRWLVKSLSDVCFSFWYCKSDSEGHHDISLDWKIDLNVAVFLKKPRWEECIHHPIYLKRFVEEWKSRILGLSVTIYRFHLHELLYEATHKWIVQSVWRQFWSQISIPANLICCGLMGLAGQSGRFWSHLLWGMELCDWQTYPFRLKNRCKTLNVGQMIV
jgi:hypothetical protein